MTIYANPRNKKALGSRRLISGRPSLGRFKPVKSYVGFRGRVPSFPVKKISACNVRVMVKSATKSVVRSDIWPMLGVGVMVLLSLLCVIALVATYFSFSDAPLTINEIKMFG